MKKSSLMLMSLLMSAGIAFAQTAPAPDAGDPNNTTEKGLHPKEPAKMKKAKKKTTKAKAADKASEPMAPMAEPAK